MFILTLVPLLLNLILNFSCQIIKKISFQMKIAQFFVTFLTSGNLFSKKIEVTIVKINSVEAMSLK